MCTLKTKQNVHLGLGQSELKFVVDFASVLKDKCSWNKRLHQLLIKSCSTEILETCTRVI